MAMRSKAYATSREVTSRSSGGPNRTPGFRWNVYVRPCGSGIASARSGTSALPGVPAVKRCATSVRRSRLLSMFQPVAEYSPVGSSPFVKP